MSLPKPSMLSVALLALLLGAPISISASERRNPCACSLLDHIAERFGLGHFRASTDAPDRDIANKLSPGISQIQFRTSDHLKLTGYRIACDPENRLSKKSYLLVAQGDAMLASDLMLLGSLKRGLCNAFSDIYLFDYRGTGLSDADNNYCLGDVIYDYRELIGFLNGRYSQPAQSSFYGISGGAVILLNALIPSSKYPPLVIDSMPDRLGVRCWDRDFNPVAKMPADGRSIVVLFSVDDKIVKPDQMSKILDKARQSHATVLSLQGLPHFHQDSAAEREYRLGQVLSALRQ
jgi:alpha/beta superfamily hydrolase